MKVEFNKPESFSVNGFAIIRDIFTTEEINYFRELSYNLITESGSKRQLMPSETLDDSALRALPFKEKIVEALKKSLGNQLTYIPDFTLHSNQFGFPGWHTDSGSEINQSYLQSPNYKFAKCGIFLQDNTENWGGGIEVLPKGHKFPLNSRSKRLNTKIKNLLNKISIPLKKITLDIKAGDFVYFDSRLPHTSTFPSMINKPKVEGTYHYPQIPKENSKLILYWDACNDHISDHFLDNSLKRSKTDESLESCKKNLDKELFFSDYIRRFYPRDYPEDFVELATRSSVNISSLGKSECNQLTYDYKNKIKAKNL